VGAAVARNAWPARIARDGGLHVHTTDAIWAFELTQRAAEIAARLGLPAVRFAPGPIPRDELAPEATPPPEPSPEHVALAAGTASLIDADNLRKTVEKTMSLSLARSALRGAI
jgi:hypothetical protein